MPPYLQCQHRQTNKHTMNNKVNAAKKELEGINWNALIAEVLKENSKTIMGIDAIAQKVAEKI